MDPRQNQMNANAVVQRQLDEEKESPQEEPLKDTKCAACDKKATYQCSCAKINPPPNKDASAFPETSYCSQECRIIDWKAHEFHHMALLEGKELFVVNRVAYMLEEIFFVLRKQLFPAPFQGFNKVITVEGHTIKLLCSGRLPDGFEWTEKDILEWVKDEEEGRALLADRMGCIAFPWLKELFTKCLKDVVMELGAYTIIVEPRRRLFLHIDETTADVDLSKNNSHTVFTVTLNSSGRRFVIDPTCAQYGTPNLMLFKNFLQHLAAPKPSQTIGTASKERKKSSYLDHLQQRLPEERDIAQQKYVSDDVYELLDDYYGVGGTWFANILYNNDNDFVSFVHTDMDQLEQELVAARF